MIFWDMPQNNASLVYKFTKPCGFFFFYFFWKPLTLLSWCERNANKQERSSGLQKYRKLKEITVQIKHMLSVITAP